MVLWVGSLCWGQVGILLVSHVSAVCCQLVGFWGCRVAWGDGGDLAMCISSSGRLAQAFHVAGCSSKKTSKNMQGFLRPELGTSLKAILTDNEVDFTSGWEALQKYLKKSPDTGLRIIWTIFTNKLPYCCIS